MPVFPEAAGHLHSFASNLRAFFQKVSEHMNKGDLASAVYLDY